MAILITSLSFLVAIFAIEGDNGALVKCPWCTISCKRCISISDNESPLVTSNGAMGNNENLIRQLDNFTFATSWFLTIAKRFYLVFHDMDYFRTMRISTGIK
jgi:hypothetical protein